MPRVWHPCYRSIILALWTNDVTMFFIKKWWQINFLKISAYKWKTVNKKGLSSARTSRHIYFYFDLQRTFNECERVVYWCYLHLPPCLSHKRVDRGNNCTDIVVCLNITEKKNALKPSTVWMNYEHHFSLRRQINSRVPNSSCHSKVSSLYFSRINSMIQVFFPWNVGNEKVKRELFSVHLNLLLNASIISPVSELWWSGCLFVRQKHISEW